MPKGPFTIVVTSYFDREDPDGSECVACGDKCYLKMWRLFYSIEKSGRLLRHKTVLCDSCHQAAMES